MFLRHKQHILEILGLQKVILFIFQYSFVELKLFWDTYMTRHGVAYDAAGRSE